MRVGVSTYLWVVAYCCSSFQVDLKRPSTDENADAQNSLSRKIQVSNVELLHAYKRLADQQAAFASRNLAMGTPTVIIAVLLLYAFNSLAEAKGFGCKGITSEKDREEVLRLHNEYRANLTKGATVVHSMTGKKQALPAAKNMYELEWDCDLEAKAEDAMNMTCKYAARRRYRTYGHTRGKWQVCIKFNKPVEEYGVQGVLQQWFEEGLGFDTLERRFEDFSVENFVNMASGRNTKIGCAVTKRGQRADVYCLYDLPLRAGALVYEAGNGCKTDADCTTYKNSKCLPSGLCHGVPEPGYKERSNCFPGE
ncbi:hypothetical protein Y032_0066g3712 [Ancylostoma ceylanicum]|uniref:SCP domain-containing protein n=1 Tax=Ancylostoma ceylanicum TaxID=53326 RepID=A0A016U0F7_9BILA|nr:hypothetical protein Y032_0066g3712 [Ancylostoma ceylanicum]